MDGEQGILLALEPNKEGQERTGDCRLPGSRVAKPRFQAIDREQLSWQAVDVERLIAEDHPARAIWEFVGKLDLSAYTVRARAIEGMAGRPTLDPQLMISLWVYAYSTGVGSARAIEKLCEHNPAYQWLTGTQVVNAHSLSDFRVAHQEALEELFVQVLGLLSADGMITLERVMQDGTKIRASAAGNSFRTEKGLQAALQAAQEHVDAVNQTSEEELSRRALKAKERAKQLRSERLKSALDELRRLQEEKGNKEEAKIRVSTTDPESRVMKHPDGGFAPSYNVQVNTDSANGVVVAVDVTQAGNDFDQLVPGVKRVEENLGETPKQVVADGGYVSRDNIMEMQERGVDFIGPQCDDAAKARAVYSSQGTGPEYYSDKFVYDAEKDQFVCPQGRILIYTSKEERTSHVSYRYRAELADCQQCPAKGQCCPKNKLSGRSVYRSVESPELAKFRERMATEEARATYGQRAQIAETPNLWIKAKFKLRQFCVRGLSKVRMEALWACMTYNIRLWIRLRWRMNTAAALAVV